MPYIYLFNGSACLEAPSTDRTELLGLRRVEAMRNT